MPRLPAPPTRFYAMRDFFFLRALLATRLCQVDAARHAAASAFAAMLARADTAIF